MRVCDIDIGESSRRGGAIRLCRITRSWLNGFSLAESKDTTSQLCLHLCLQHEHCLSFNYQTSSKTCQLIGVLHTDQPISFIQGLADDFSHWSSAYDCSTYS